MACGCGGRAQANNAGTLGYYVILPDGSLMPRGVNPADPEAGEPPYFFYSEARAEVVMNGGGTIKRLKRAAATAAAS